MRANYAITKEDVDNLPQNHIIIASVCGSDDVIVRSLDDVCKDFQTFQEENNLENKSNLKNSDVIEWYMEDHNGNNTEIVVLFDNKMQTISISNVLGD